MHSPSALKEVAKLFLKLGCTAFGGPAAHVGMMEDEVVTRRQWISRQHFLDLVGATNLIPGPNSTEMTMHIGYERAGWRGLIVAGSCFIIPAAVICCVFAWAYQRYGALPAVEPFLAGVKPVVLAVIVAAIGRLGRQAVKDARSLVLGVIVAAATLAGVNEVLALLVGGVGGMLWFRSATRPTVALTALLLGAGAPASPVAASVAVPLSLWKLSLFFLKVGSVMYGTGYVLVAFLQGDLVERYGWLTQTQLLDAIAVGQFTPGPLLCTATFIGYLLFGVPGAVVATVAIFLPSFVLVWMFNPIIPRLRQSPWAGAFLDAVNICAVALMAAVILQLGPAVLTTWSGVGIGLLALAVLIRYRVNTTWLILAGAVLGYLVALIPG